MNIKNCLENITARFTAARFDSPDIEAAYLIAEVTGIRHNLLFFHGEQELTDGELQQVETFLERRLKHEPFQYIYGWTEFRYLKLFVGPGCLIPRPETELLVDLVLQRIPEKALLCEVGVGSGAISLSLAYERKSCYVFGSEISDDALKWAERNRKALDFKNVEFVSGNLLEPFKGRKFDAIVANLPYIPYQAEMSLPENVRNYEPKQALYAGDDGLALIADLIRQAPDCLKPHGFLFLEIGEDQGKRAVGIAESTRSYSKTELLRDQYQVDRFLILSR